MKVLIAFVTTNDPWSDKPGGPAQTVTAALALNPGAIHLIYTQITRNNYNRTIEYLKQCCNDIILYPHFLELADVTDYRQLKKLIPDTVKSIRKEHPGGNFYLVSGLPQARFIFSLCLTAQVIDGVLIEVQRPEKDDPWPKNSSGYSKRIEELDLEFFNYFRQLFLEKYKAIRLKLDLETEEMLMDDKPFDFRARATDESITPSRRAFKLMVLLAAQKIYGNKSFIPKAIITKHIYRDTDNPGINIPRTIAKINAQARTITKKSSRPFDSLILSDRNGHYWLADNLSPADETIEISGNLVDYLKSMKLWAVKATYFPLLG